MNYESMTEDELEVLVEEMLQGTDIDDPKEQINYVMANNEALGIAYTNKIAEGF